MKIPILLPNIFNHPFTYKTNNEHLKKGDYVEVPFGKTNKIMIRFIKPILKFFVKSNAVKSLVLGLLQDYADSTETDIDNELVKLVKEKLWPVT